MSDRTVLSLAAVDAMVLAGGLGTRLRGVVPDKPKCLAEIAGRPFLAYLIEHLSGQGLRHIVLCTGHMGPMVRQVIGESWGPARISYSQESGPLGTGGALRLALPQTASDTILAINGDSFCGAELSPFLAAHHQGSAAASILLTRVPDVSRYGQVGFDDQRRVTRFEEKGGSAGGGWINAGIYLISRSLLTQIPTERAVSVEKECFPTWIGQGLCAWPAAGRFIDIGTPESYAEAQSFFTRTI